jgi:hypothetical protein
LPEADWRFDAPKDLSLKLLFKLDSEQSSSGEPFYYLESDSIPTLPAKLSVYLMAQPGLARRIRKILWRLGTAAPDGIEGRLIEQ